MNIDLSVLLGTVILLCWALIIIRYIINDIYTKKLILKKNIPLLFEELNIIITNEFNFAVKLPYMAQDFTMITDIKNTVSFISKRIMYAISEEYFDHFVKHGVTKSYVMLYIVRQIELLLIDYMRNNNYNMQKK